MVEPVALKNRKPKGTNIPSTKSPIFSEAVSGVHMMTKVLRVATGLGPRSLQEQVGPGIVKVEEEKEKCFPSLEMFSQHFRQFEYHDITGPWEALSQLHVLCCEWLRPKIYSKE